MWLWMERTHEEECKTNDCGMGKELRWSHYPDLFLHLLTPHTKATNNSHFISLSRSHWSTFRIPNMFIITSVSKLLGSSIKESDRSQRRKFSASCDSFDRESVFLVRRGDPSTFLHTRRKMLARVLIAGQTLSSPQFETVLPCVVSWDEMGTTIKFKAANEPDLIYIPRTNCSIDCDRIKNHVRHRKQQICTFSIALDRVRLGMKQAATMTWSFKHHSTRISLLSRRWSWRAETKQSGSQQ